MSTSPQHAYRLIDAGTGTVMDPDQLYVLDVSRWSEEEIEALAGNDNTAIDAAFNEGLHVSPPQLLATLPHTYPAV